MTKFLVGITSADALHTWEYADKTRRETLGSAGTLSLSQRKKRELNRKTIGAYRDSKVASVATATRGEVSKFTNSERQKIANRPDSAQNTPGVAPIKASLKERPISNLSVYRPKI